MLVTLQLCKFCREESNGLWFLPPTSFLSSRSQVCTMLMLPDSQSCSGRYYSLFFIHWSYGFPIRTQVLIITLTVSKVCRSIVHFIFLYNSLTIFQKMGVTSIEYFCVTIVLFLCPPSPSLFFFFLGTMCCPLLLGVFRGWWSYHVSLFLIIHISPQFGKRDLRSLSRIRLQLVCEFSIMFLSTYQLIQAFAYSNFVQCNIGHPNTPTSKLVTETSTP